MSGSNFMALSDNDEEYNTFRLNDDDSPVKGHSRQGSASEGHLYAGRHSTAGMRAAEQGRGVFGEAVSSGRSGQGGGSSQDTLTVLKTKSLSLAAYLREKATLAGSSVADPNSRQQTLSKLKFWGAGAAEKVQSATAVGWQQARDLTSEGMKRLYGGSLEALCKQEHSERPCPRTVLICCTYICCNGLYTEGIFKEEAPMELVHYLLGAFEEGQGICMPPPGTAPLVVASALMQFLRTLPEPIFTFKALPEIIAAGQETVPTRTPEALAELPAANLNALTMLLETWHRVAENCPANGMDARAIAVSVAPCLAWHPPLGKDARKGYQAVGVPTEDEGGSWRRGMSFPETAATEAEEGGAMAKSDLEPEDLAAVISVVEYAITNFRGSGGNDFNSPLYDSERVSQRASASEFVGARSSEQQVPGPPPLKPHAKTSSVESDPISPPPRALEKQPSLI